MEEKLDQIIELLEQQNQLIERSIRLQTTNNFTKQHTAHPVPDRSVQGREGMPDVKAMIEDAKTKAMASMQSQMGKTKR